MTRFSRPTCIGLSLIMLAASVSKAQTPRTLPEASGVSSENVEMPERTAISIAIITSSAITGVTATQYARSQNQAAVSRETVNKLPIYDGGGQRLVTPVEPTLSEIVLRGTLPGDVVRFEYIAGTEAALEQAVVDLRHSKGVWTARVDELSKQRSGLAEAVQEVRRLFADLPLNEEAKSLRYEALTKMQKLETELKSVTKLLEDADMRMHSARGQYAAASRNFDVSHRVHRMNQRLHIIQDVLVDGNPNQLDVAFGRMLGEATSRTSAHEAIPHIRVARIVVPNSSVVARSVRNVRAGLWMAGISAAIILEEVTVGMISDRLAVKSRTQFSPTIRTEPDQN